MSPSDREKILFIDIETVPIVYSYNDLTDAARKLWDRKWSYSRDTDPATQYTKAGIFAEFAKVVCIGCGYFEKNDFVLTVLHSRDEKDLLHRFSSLLSEMLKSGRPLLCAHNGKEFDYPFLCRRYIVNGISLPRQLQLQGLKPWNVPHADTMELWKFGDVKHYTSLELLAHIFDIPSPKNDIDGSMVARVFHEENGLERIAGYCGRDVLTLARVYSRFCGADDFAMARPGPAERIN
jgi:3'-5' exonuclease